MKRVIFAVLLVGCDEPLDQRLAIIEEPRILAIVAEPAEAKPGDTVTYNAIVASPDGPILQPPDWSYCIAGKPPTEDNAVAPACLGDESVIILGTQVAMTATLPGDGCRVFGPDVPDVGFRPRDPDPSGGYFQPIRADVGELRAFGLSRISCKLPDAPAEIAHAWLERYAPNVTPGLVEVSIPRTLDAGSAVELVAEWPQGSIEPYLWYDRANAKLVERREALRVSWYATRGELDVDATGILEGDDATSVATTYHAPIEPGPAWLWIVLRDSRGGIATQTIELTIR